MYLAIIIIINIIWIENICNFNAITELEVGDILQLHDNYFCELSVMLPPTQMLNNISQMSCLCNQERLGMPAHLGAHVCHACHSGHFTNVRQTLIK